MTAIRRRLIGRDEALRLYDLSDDELTSWERGFDIAGQAGLRVDPARRRVV